MTFSQQPFFHVIHDRLKLAVQFALRGFHLQERPDERLASVFVDRGVRQCDAQSVQILQRPDKCGLGELQNVRSVRVERGFEVAPGFVFARHAGSLAERAAEEKPKQWDTDLGRPAFWFALVITLFIWALWTKFAPLQLLLTVIGTLLGASVSVVGAPVQLSDDQRRLVEQRIRKAMALADLSVNAAAICYYGQADRATDFVKALRGERPLDIARLEILLGDEFARHYSILTLIEKGPPTYIRQALKVIPEGAA